MKKVLSLLFVALLALSAWADTTVTFIPGETVGSNTTATAADEMSLDGVKFSCTTAAFAAAQYRFGGGSTTTITSTVGKIKKIEFTCTASYGQSYGPNQLYGDGYSSQSGSNVGTWQGEAETIVLKAASQCRVSKIVVTIAKDVVTELVAPVFTPNGGEFSGSLEVTLSCATQNAQIYYWEGTEEEQSETKPPADRSRAQRKVLRTERVLRSASVGAKRVPLARSTFCVPNRTLLFVYKTSGPGKRVNKPFLKKGVGSWIKKSGHSLKWSLKYFRTFA